MQNSFQPIKIARLSAKVSFQPIKIDRLSAKKSSVFSKLLLFLFKLLRPCSAIDARINAPRPPANVPVALCTTATNADLRVPVTFARKHPPVLCVICVKGIGPTHKCGQCGRSVHNAIKGCSIFSEETNSSIFVKFVQKRKTTKLLLLLVAVAAPSPITNC